MSMEPAEMTDRLLRALESPNIHVLGHPTGRIILQREPYPFDFERVAAMAARRNVFLEINGSPERLDLGGAMIRTARALGAKFAIGTDSHHPKSLAANMPYGILMARRGWLEPADVLNALGYEDLKRALRKS
jgi:DNA polymerase (family 10)